MFKNKISAGTDAQHSTKVETQDSSARHIANAHVGSSSSSSDPTRYAAEILLKQVPEENSVCAHWISLAVLKLLKSNPKASLEEFKNIIKQLWSLDYSTAERRFNDQNS